jgi:hypothetical protein
VFLDSVTTGSPPKATIMQWGIEQLLYLGQLAMPVIGIAVLIILLISMADRHPRNDKPDDDLTPPSNPDM